MGKVHDQWIKARRDFLRLNPPNHEGYYVCYICGVWVLESEITVDHIVSRSRAPHLRYTFSNLAVCCSSCNEAKGSKDIVKQQEEEPDTELDGLW